MVIAEVDDDDHVKIKNKLTLIPKRENVSLKMIFELIFVNSFKNFETTSEKRS